MTKFNPIERIGVHKVALTFLTEFGWIEREQPISDFGIDMHVEIVQNLIPTGQIIALQIKSGMSYFSEENEKSIIYRGQKKHLDYWLNQSLPVLIVLYNPDSEKSYWEFVSSSKITELEKGWKIEIPKTNILTLSKEKITQVYSNPNHYTTLNISDTSHIGARRISAKILVESTQAKSKFSMKNMIPSIVEKLKLSDYYGNERIRENFKDKPADIVFLFFYDGIQQVERGLTFCRAIWNNKNCKYPLSPFVADEVVDEIEIIWDTNYSAFTDFIPDNELPKGFYLDNADDVFKKSKIIYDILNKELSEYQKKGNYKKLLSSILFLQSDLDNLNNNPLNEGFPPLECQYIDSLISGIVVFLHNILIIANDRNRDEKNVIYLLKDYLRAVEEKLPFYEYERKKVN
ncbi:DUF4365 domain-containing protein [Owenweeksia hongkongensis]|uniref:DUF4365 domain-containing protein n=1 Tax=Owenweeksia hongkongensis TaxID=253245 RepID=UPI003A8FA7FF